MSKRTSSIIKFEESKHLPRTVGRKSMSDDTEAIINRIGMTKTSYLTVRFSGDDGDEVAKKRVESVRRARARKQVSFQNVIRRRNVLCFKLR